MRPVVRPLILWSSFLPLAAALPEQAPAKPTKTAPAASKPAQRAPARPERSHSFRFASPEEQARQTEAELTAKLKKTPNVTKLWLERGGLRLRQGRDEEAIQDFRRALALDPKSADAHTSLGHARFAQRLFSEAQREFDAALKLDPAHSSANFYTARILLLTGGDRAQAIAHMEKAAQRDPENLDIQFELFDAYRKGGDVLKASQQLEVIRMLLPPESPALAYSDGLIQADLGNVPRAAVLFRKAFKGNPGNDRIRQDLGVALVQTDQWQEAAVVLGPLAQSQPRNYSAAYFHALALSNTGQLDDALAEAIRAQGLAPDVAGAHSLVGVVHFRRGEFSDAVTSLQQALALDPSDLDSEFFLGRALYGMNDAAGAAVHLRKAVDGRPEDPEARFFLATMLEVAGHKDAAIAEYRELIRRRPEDAKGYLGLGAILQKYGQEDEALADLRKARELDPNGYESALALGKMLAKRNQTEEGIQLLQAAAAAAPEKAEAHFQLGMLLRKAGKTAEAQQQFALVEQLNKAVRETESPKKD